MALWKIRARMHRILLWVSNERRMANCFVHRGIERVQEDRPWWFNEIRPALLDMGRYYGDMSYHLYRSRGRRPIRVGERAVRIGLRPSAKVRARILTDAWLSAILYYRTLYSQPERR